MKPEFTPDGVSVQTFQEIYDELADGYRAIYGNDINLDPDSPDGQRVGIEAQSRLDLQSYGAYVYTQIDPDTAIGQAQNVIIKFAGITRRPATRSQVDVDIVTDRPVTLPDDYTVEDLLGQSWVTLSEKVLTAGSNSVTLFAKEYGALEADPDTVTEIATVVLGITSVTNPSSATVGRDEETDEELRERRNNSLETPTSSSTGRLFTALASVTNVTDVAVYENDTDVTDADGIPAHSLWVVVEGGSIADIVETMVKNKTGGKPMVGSVTAEYEEIVVRPDGTDFIIIHEMTFDRPVLVPVDVRLNATRKDASDPVDTSLIAEKIAERTFNIGINLLAGDLYRNSFEAGDGFVPTDLEVSRDGGGTWTDGRILTDLNEKFTIDAADVDVTEII